ncbi:hypothetical protein FA13DRAFT_1619127, partial [Coprinellus micaceus]
DKLVHYGRHFGRTVLTFCDTTALVHQGVAREEQMSRNGVKVAHLVESERKKHEAFRTLLNMCPHLLNERLFAMARTEDDLDYVAEKLSKGISDARLNDLKTLKMSIVDWITPPGGVLTPSLLRNSKVGRGFHHQATGKLLCPTDYDWANPNVQARLRSGELAVTGLQWPLFLWVGSKCKEDDLWDGFMRSRLLLQAYKHIFTSPSSVDGDCKSNRSGNAGIHGMTSVTVPSLVYVATLVCFSLSDAGTWSRNDTQLDSNRFYHSLLSFLDRDEEHHFVKDLLTWWNSQVFPGQATIGSASVPETCALAKMTAKRQALSQTSRDNVDTTS